MFTVTKVPMVSCQEGIRLFLLIKSLASSSSSLRSSLKDGASVEVSLSLVRGPFLRPRPRLRRGRASRSPNSDTVSSFVSARGMSWTKSKSSFDSMGSSTNAKLSFSWIPAPNPLDFLGGWDGEGRLSDGASRLERSTREAAGRSDLSVRGVRSLDSPRAGLSGRGGLSPLDSSEREGRSCRSETSARGARSGRSARGGRSPRSGRLGRSAFEFSDRAGLG